MGCQSSTISPEKGREMRGEGRKKRRRKNEDEEE